jgi:hypothetical protein
MKVKLFAVVSAVSMLAAGAAFSQDVQPLGTSGPSASQQPMPTAKPASAMDRGPDPGYGPQPGGSSGSGRVRDGESCVVGLSCDIYQSS